LLAIKKKKKRSGRGSRNTSSVWRRGTWICTCGECSKKKPSGMAWFHDEVSSYVLTSSHGVCVCWKSSSYKVYKYWGLW